MMRIDIISAVPELLESPFQHSILQRAIKKGIVEVYTHDLRDYAINKHGQIDDYAYGGGAGMVMRIEPIAACIGKLQDERVYDRIMYMTPDGESWNQTQANQCSLLENMIILCGHYKGVDQRVRDRHITHEISVGDFVLSGGELAAAIVADSVIRLIPGVLNDETSALTDSFQDDMLAPPVYTRPEAFDGMQVPALLLSGNTKKIEEWRLEEAYKRTQEKRPDLLKKDKE
jgi:tRNA (guanine37-N1)-methyltransferase